jgi:hypothetical protein
LQDWSWQLDSVIPIHIKHIDINIQIQEVEKPIQMVSVFNTGVAY